VATVLITGASGFIGRVVRDGLLADGWDVVALRRRSSPSSSTGRTVEVDYADVEHLTRVVDRESPRAVVHVAGATKGVTLNDFRRANVRPTETLVQACEAVGVERFVFVSSLVSFGPSAPDRPHDERSSPAPVEFYGQTKREAEERVEASSLPYVILRPGGVYGPGDVDYFQLFKSAAGGWNVFFGNRERRFSKLYVDDMLGFVRASLRGPTRAAYFVCDGTPVTWGEFQGEIVRQAGRKVRELDLPEALVSIAAWGGERLSSLDGKPRLLNRQKAIMGRQSAWTCDPRSAIRALGYTPEFDLARGVAESFAWYRTHGWLPPGDAP
jgi:nucleoside-diphosphate-sugar epimerase